MYEWLIRKIGEIGGWLCLSLCGFTCFEVFMRYILRHGLEFYLEVAGYIALVAVFCGTAYAYLEGRHIAVDFLLLRLKPLKREKLLRLNHGIVGVFSLLIGCITTRVAFDSYQIGKSSPTHLRLPLWPLEFIMAMGWLLLGIYALKKVKEKSL